MEEQAENFEEICSLIEEGKLQEAQELLDKTEEHSAEWNYVQSELFRKKQWYAECRKQLRFALEKDPGNEKYIRAQETLENMSHTEKEEKKKRKSAAHGDSAKDACGECILACSCELCAQGICEFLFGGCS